nr:EamA family transporter [Cohnella mopanensis]
MLAAFAALMFVIQTLCLKKLPELRSNRAMFGLIAAYSSLIALGLLLWWVIGGAPAISSGTWLFGCLYGGVFTSTMFFYTRAMNTGPLSYSSFYFSVSLMVPVVASMTLWHEAAGPAKLTGLALFLLSFYFIQIYGRQRGNTVQQAGKRWFVYCLLAFLFNGLIPVLAKAHQSMLDGRESTELTLVGFSAALVCSLLGWIGSGRLRQSEASFDRIPFSRSSVIFILGVGLSTGAGNALMNDLSGRLPGAYLYPFVNGSMIVLLTLISAFVFKEKLSKGGVLGIATGIAAIVAVNV